MNNALWFYIEQFRPLFKRFIFIRNFCQFSFERLCVEFAKLVEAAMPLVKAPLKVDEVNGKLLDEGRVELTLIQLYLVVESVLHFEILNELRDEFELLFTFFF